MTDTADPTTAETPPKRGRGRPPGAYGKYRPRLPEELKEPDELNPLAKKLNEDFITFHLTLVNGHILCKKDMKESRS
jgi:hypothetical protein